MTNEEILQEALNNFEESQTAEQENRADSLASSRFVDGKQWPDNIREERIASGRPCLTINKLRKFVRGLSGEIEKNRPSIQVRPEDKGSDIETAQVFNDIIRHIEEISNAPKVYDNGLLQALSGGYGYWRIITEYLPMSFDQEIKIKKINNRFSVYLDQNSEEYSYSDGEYAFITQNISRKDFEQRYPDEEISDWDSSIGDSFYQWYTQDEVRVAEYFFKEWEETEIVQLPNGETIKVDSLIDQEKEMIKDFFGEFKTRKERMSTIKWCLLCRDSIIEGPLKIPGEYIPIVPILGYEENDEGRRRFRSMIYDSMDSMRMYNYWKTHATEVVALAPKAPYKLTPQQIEGHQSQWDDANIKNYPYLLYNDIPGQSLPKRESPITSPTGIVNEAQMASMDIQDTIGRYSASLGQPSNERSGRAILARKSGSDSTTFAFADNLMTSIVFTGKILIKMIPEVYDTDRVIKMLGKDGNPKEVKLNSETKDLETGETFIQNDLSKGKYNIVATAGPSFQTKRLEIASSMLDFLQFVPQSAPVIAPKLASLMDWEGAQTIASELSSLFNPQEQQSKSGQKNNNINELTPLGGNLNAGRNEGV